MAMVAAAAGMAITFAPMAAAPAHASQPGATIVALAEQEANNSGRNYETDISGNPSSTKLYLLRRPTELQLAIVRPIGLGLAGRLRGQRQRVCLVCDVQPVYLEDRRAVQLHRGRHVGAVVQGLL
jgi:hypothetical protein